MASPGSAVANGREQIAITVTLRDTSGAPLAGLAVRLEATGTGNSLSQPASVTDASGVATGALASTEAEAKTVTAFTGSPEVALPGRPAVSFAPAPPARLTFRAQPSTSPAGAPISPAVEVQVEDELGRVVASATNAVSLARSAGPSGASLSGTTTVNAAAGVASFPDLRLDVPGTGYALQATANGLATATSSTFAVTAVATRLVFLAQPTAQAAGGTISPAVQVALADGAGNLATGPDQTVALSFAPGSSAGTLLGTGSAGTVNGVATFTSLSIREAGSYALRASASGLADGTSDTFAIRPGPAATLAFVAQPSDTTAGQPMSPPPSVEVLDAYSNRVTSSTLTVGAYATSGSTGGNTYAPAQNGVATFTDLRPLRSGLNSLGTVAPGLSTAYSRAFQVAPGPASALLLRASPADGTSLAALSPPAVFEVDDAFGNRAATDVPVSISLTPKSAPGTLAGTTSATSSGGQVTFDALQIDSGLGGGRYALRASSPGLGAATTYPFVAARSDAGTPDAGTQPLGGSCAPPCDRNDQCAPYDGASCDYYDHYCTLYCGTVNDCPVGWACIGFSGNTRCVPPSGVCQPECPRADGGVAASKLFTPFSGWTQDLAVNATHVYFATGSGLERVQKDGTYLYDWVVYMGNSVAPTDLVIDGGTLYYEYGGLWTTPLAQPGPPPPYGLNWGAFALWGGVVYVTYAGAYGSVVAEDANTRDLLYWVSPSENSPISITTDGRELHWLNNGGYGSTEVVQAPMDGGAPRKILSEEGNGRVVASGGGRVFYADQGDSYQGYANGFIESLPSLGGPGQIIARDQGRPTRLQVDGANLYWLDNCSGALMTSGTDGSNVRVLASGFDYPFDIALDTGLIYVSDRGGIWTVPR